MTSFNVKPWQGFQRRSWAVLVDQLRDLPAQQAQRGSVALDDVAGRSVNAVIAGGGTLRAPISPAAPALLDAISEAASRAADGAVSFVVLNHIDMLGVLASVGVDVPDSAFARAREILAAIPTSRNDERVVNHFRRGFMAVALQEPAVYRGIIGRAGEPSVPFTPGETFGPNVHGFLTHLAGAVEGGAALDACLPAFGDFLEHYFALQQAGNASASVLFWAGFILHHRLGKQPLATLGDWLHETLYKAGGEAP